MKTARLILGAICMTLLVGCSDKAKDMLEMAAFEERQSNFPHAIQLYQELAQAYPESKEGEIARNRIADLKSRQ